MKRLNNDNAYKYNDLISELRRQIFTGELKEGDRLPSERKLAEIFGYSRVTIRSALQQLKEERLVEQIQGKGTFVRSWQQEINAELDGNDVRQLKVACMCYQEPGVNIDLDPYYNQIFLGLHRTEYDNVNYDLKPVPFAPDEALTERIEQLRNDYDGFIIISYSIKDKDVKYLEDEGINYVTMGKGDTLRHYSYVDVDNFAGLYMCTEELIKHGRKNILLLINSFSTPLDRDRINGYKTALTDYGLPVDEDLIKNVHIRKWEDNEPVIMDVVENRTKYDGVIAFGDWTTYWLVNALMENGIRVPEDIAIIGYSIFSWICHGLNMRVTNLIQPFPEMGRRSLLMLTERCLGIRDDIQVSIIRPQLELGESSPAPNE